MGMMLSAAACLAAATQIVLTLALAEQGRVSCPFAAAMMRSFSSVSEMPKVAAQCFNTSSISCIGEAAGEHNIWSERVCSCLLGAAG